MRAPFGHTFQNVLYVELRTTFGTGPLGSNHRFTIEEEAYALFCIQTSVCCGIDLPLGQSFHHATVCARDHGKPARLREGPERRRGKQSNRRTDWKLPDRQQEDRYGFFRLLSILEFAPGRLHAQCDSFWFPESEAIRNCA